MESRSCTEPQQIGHFRSRIGFEIISVPEFMMRGEKPARIRLDALQRANVVFKVDMPARGMGVFLALRIWRERIKIGFCPKTFWKRRESKPSVKLLGRLDNPFGLSSFEVLVDVGG